jgi:hypothetical protein
MEHNCTASQPTLSFHFGRKHDCPTDIRFASLTAIIYEPIAI